MKKILLAIFALLPVLTAFAQTDWTVPTQKFDQYWIGGVRFGFAQFSGDISNGSFFSKLNKESKPSYSINLGRQISPMFSVSASYSNSHYFSKGSFMWHPNTTELTDMSVTGKISEFGLYGTLNLNKLFSSNKEAGNNWNIYVTSGLGIASWTCDLLDKGNNIVGKVRNSKAYDLTVDSITKIAFSSKRTIPLTIGLNLQLLDGVWLSLEHSMRFVNSDAMDAVFSGYTDIYTTTTFGITANLQKLFSFHLKRDNVPASTYPTSISTSRTSRSKPIKTEKRSFLRRSGKIKPELQEYTGYNALLPPPQPKADTSRKTKSLGVNGSKNIWVAESDSGQLQITGAKKIINEGFHGTDPQTGADLQTGIVPTYRIQIQASKTYIAVDAVIKKLDLKEKVSVELRSDGWYRYYIGQFSKLPEAKTKLSEMRSKGFKDAFIVSFKTNTRKVIKK